MSYVMVLLHKAGQYKNLWLTMAT